MADVKMSQEGNRRMHRIMIGSAIIPLPPVYGMRIVGHLRRVMWGAAVINQCVILTLWKSSGVTRYHQLLSGTA